MKEEIYKRLLTLSQSGKPLTSSVLSTLPVPAPFRYFLGRVLARQLERETEKISIPQSGWFDTSTGDIERSAREFVRVIRNNGQFPEVELESYLRRATDIVTDYVINPVATILRFGFPPETDSMLKADLTLRLSYFELYPTLLNVVQNDLSESVSRADLESELSALETGSWNNLSPEDWMTQLGPVCELLAFASEDKLFTDSLARFTQHRGDPKVHNALIDTAKSGKQALTILELASIVEAALRPPPPEPEPEPEPQPKPQQQPRRRSFPAVVPEKMTTADVLAASSSSGELPLWQQFSDANPVSGNANSPGTPSSSSPLWKSYTADNDSFMELERTVLGAAGDQREMFVRVLFKGDEDMYQQILRRLGGCATWAEASLILKNEVFLANRIDIYSEASIAFTNAVEERIKQLSR